ncbi:MAG: DNA polymerase III subunit gamma and tau, partial [Actinomycetota bacterium]|nr:DNA polymerase III subunit gamma and tau [Actinomycetota bacterium]
MSLALYRKYRPGSFAEVIGQEHVTAPLQQALRNGKVHHAYLFSGPRGCGKTSSARILARSLNCEQGPTPTPCGSCDSCVALAPNGAGSLDVVEIDAASHGGVDDARDLRERAFYAPVSSRYKIYIVDEAHMVTAGAFNALLKLVEEPPSHLKFVFATTEPDKVLTTIRSRTHHYPFRLVPAGVLREHLAGVCAREGVEVDPLVLPLVVRAGAGSVRDALSILDQLLAGADADGVSYARAVSLLGYTDATLLDEVVDAFAAGDGAGVFEVVDKVMEAGHDPRRFAADLLERLRDLVILDAVPDAAAKGLLDLPAEQLERMSGQAGRMGSAALSRAADLLNTGLTEMRGAMAPRLLLELVCARVLLPGAATGEGAVLTRLERLERRLAIAPDPGAVAARPAARPPTPPSAAPPSAAPQRVPAASAA